MRLGGFQPFTLSDYPGYCAAIVFTAGCNLRCPYCHNWALWQTPETPLAEERWFDFLHQQQGKLDGVVVTGGEPTIQQDLARFLGRIKQLKYRIKLDTNGTAPQVVRELISAKLLDFIAMDIKAPIAKYLQLAGAVVAPANIQESIDLIATSGVDHLFRTTWDHERLSIEDIEEIKKMVPPASSWVLQECRPELAYTNAENLKA